MEHRGRETFTTFEDLEGLHHAIVRWVALLPRSLSANEFRFLRKECGWTQRTLAPLLGVEEQTVSLWERGQSPIPKAADILMRGFAADKLGISTPPTLELSSLVERQAVSEPARFFRIGEVWLAKPEVGNFVLTRASGTSHTARLPAIREMARSIFSIEDEPGTYRIRVEDAYEASSADLDEALERRRAPLDLLVANR